MILKLESTLKCQMSNYMAKGLEKILEAKILKFSVRKEQDRLAESILNYFFGEYDMKGILIPA